MLILVSVLDTQYKGAEMQMNLQAKKLHRGIPVEIDLELNITPAEMIEIYQAAPGIVKEFRTMMREDKIEKAMAKAKKNMQPKGA